MGVQPFDKDPDSVMNHYILKALGEVDKNVYGKYYDQNGEANQYQTRPYEWGNPPGVHPELIGRKKGVCPGQVYSINDGHTEVKLKDQCILTFHQEKCLTEPEKYYDVCSLSCDEYKEDWLHEVP